MFDGNPLKTTLGTSSVVQWLRLHLPVQGGEGSIPGGDAKTPHASRPTNQSITNRSNIVTHSIYFFKKWSTSKKKKKKLTLVPYLLKEDPEGKK